VNFRFAGALAAWCVVTAPSDFEAQTRRIIPIATTAELYAAAESDANRDATLMLRAGTYILSRPLRLRPGMEIAGENRYQDTDRDGVWDALPDGAWVLERETILDARAMPVERPIARDCNPGGVSTGNPEPAVVVGQRNRVRGLTIKSPPEGAGIGEAGEPRAEATVQIEDVVVDGGRRAAVIGNRGCGARRFRSTLAFNRNVITGSQVGLTLANLVTDRDGLVEGPSTVATLRRNRFTRNATGLAINGGMQGTDGGRIDVTSLQNRFEHNSAGAVAIRSGASQPSTPPASANGNTVRFFSTNDVLQANGAPALLFVASDRLAMGETTGGENHGNRLEAHLINPSIDGPSPGVHAIGGRYRGADATARSGTGNVVRLFVSRVSALPLSIQSDDDLPARTARIDPPNRVEIRR
jgi:hypothetical protein